jgi:hypothetical protein
LISSLRSTSEHHPCNINGTKQMQDRVLTVTLLEKFYHAGKTINNH